MPNKFYPDANPDDECNWVTVHSQPAVIVQVPVGILTQGEKVVTAYLQTLGFMVTSAADWHESLAVPDQP